MARVYHSRIAADATAQGHLGGDYGLTLPTRIVFVVGVKKGGGDWVPVVTSMTGEYCVQARILGHQSDVTSATIPGLANRGNFQAILDALNQLGVPAATHNFYSVAAVQAHEDAHANRCRLALENKAPDIVASIEALHVPINTGVGPDRDAAQGLAAIQALPAYTAVDGGAYTGTGWTLWFNELLRLVAQDHVGEEWCHVAERRVTNALVAEINALVERSQWRAQPGQVALPALALGVNAAQGRIAAVAPVVQAGPVQMPQGALGVAQARAQVQHVDAPRRGGPVDIPDGALGVAAAQARFQRAENGDAAPLRPQLKPLPKGNLPVWPPPPKQ